MADVTQHFANGDPVTRESTTCFTSKASEENRNHRVEETRRCVLLSFTLYATGKPLSRFATFSATPCGFEQKNPIVPTLQYCVKKYSFLNPPRKPQLYSHFKDSSTVRISVSFWI